MRSTSELDDATGTVRSLREGFMRAAQPYAEKETETWSPLDIGSGPVPGEMHLAAGQEPVDWEPLCRAFGVPDAAHVLARITSSSRTRIAAGPSTSRGGPIE